MGWVGVEPTGPFGHRITACVSRLSQPTQRWTLGWEFPGSLSAGYRRKGCSVCGQAHTDRVCTPIRGQAFPHRGHPSWVRPGKVNPGRRKEETEVTSNLNPQTTTKYWTNNLKEDVVFYCAQPKHKSKATILFFFYWDIVDLHCCVSGVQWSDSVCVCFFPLWLLKGKGGRGHIRSLWLADTNYCIKQINIKILL